jgi:hypothetical protein
MADGQYRGIGRLDVWMATEPEGPETTSKVREAISAACGMPFTLPRDPRTPRITNDQTLH